MTCTLDGVLIMTDQLGLNLDNREVAAIDARAVTQICEDWPGDRARRHCAGPASEAD